MDWNLLNFITSVHLKASCKDSVSITLLKAKDEQINYCLSHCQDLKIKNLE